MKEENGKDRNRQFCKAFLRTMDPEQAAKEAGCTDGFALLATKPMQQRLEKMRETAVDQIRREDVLRRMARLAFGGAGDAAKLAFAREDTLPEALDLSAVAEFKVTDKGGVEVKLVDRIRALESLFHLLESTDQTGGAELYQLLGEADGPEGSWEHG